MSNSLSFAQAIIPIAICGWTILAYQLGKSVGADHERQRIVASKRNTDKTRRAT